jgi:hypothetical protein
MSDPRESMMARWGHIQNYLFPWLREELDPCTEALERLIVVLDTIGLEAYVPAPPSHGRGRKPDDRRALARAFVGKAVLGLPTTTALIERLAIDKSLRRICGWETRRQVPSEATFSRAFAEFAEGQLPDHLHQALVTQVLGSRVIGCIARDATEIEAREKPEHKDDPPPPPSPPRKRGRPRKGEERPKEPSRIERQCGQDLEEMLADLPSACDVGCKTNSKGYKETWNGYKLHIDVADGQIPVSCILTSASVHDSQVAIPLMHMTGQRITYLYDIMDSAYDARALIEHSRSLEHLPVVDHNFRRDIDMKAEVRAEAARRALIHMPDSDQIIYNFRTMVERINARLKDEFGGRTVRVRGAVKVKCHLMFGILALAADQILRLFRPDPLPS